MTTTRFRSNSIHYLRPITIRPQPNIQEAPAIMQTPHTKTGRPQRQIPTAHKDECFGWAIELARMLEQIEPNPRFVPQPIKEYCQSHRITQTHKKMIRHRSSGNLSRYLPPQDQHKRHIQLKPERPIGLSFVSSFRNPQTKQFDVRILEAIQTLSPNRLKQSGTFLCNLYNPEKNDGHIIVIHVQKNTPHCIYYLYDPSQYLKSKPAKDQIRYLYDDKNRAIGKDQLREKLHQILLNYGCKYTHLEVINLTKN